LTSDRSNRPAYNSIWYIYHILYIYVVDIEHQDYISKEGVRRTQQQQQGRDAAQQLHTKLRRESEDEVYKRNPNGLGPNKYSPIN
jgi:hypothetical protein